MNESTVVKPPVPNKAKLAVTWVASHVPASVPWLAGFYRLIIARRPIPPFSFLSRKEMLVRLIYSHAWLLRSISRFRKVPLAQPAPATRHSTDLRQPLTELLQPKSPDQRSVIFLHHSYYHFFYLAAALRRRGWHALSVSIEDPQSPNQLYYHGEDLNLWHPDRAVLKARMADLHRAVVQNFRMLHWHGETMSAIFSDNFQNTSRDVIPWDFLELKRQGVKLGHSISGCMTGQRQSDFYRASGGVCDKCVWQLDPLVCSDAKNAAVGRMLNWLCDLIACEGDWPLIFRQGSNAYWEPLTYCIDSEHWRPDLAVPPEMRIEREPGEILIMHAVGNYDTRDNAGRNIKGTPAVVGAIEKLQAEGIPARLVFKTGVPSRDMRFYQAQADIIVDQLNYGRYGATARECLALGKPTICFLNRHQPDGSISSSLGECPLVSASEETVYDVLRDLCLSPEKRASIGKASRDYALKWHCSNACAARFEDVYDRIFSGLPVRDRG